MYDSIKKLHIELTDKCNARCPQCPRTDPTTGTEYGWIAQRELLLDDFKDIVRPSELKNITRIHIGGNYGDPIIARDVKPIISYIYKENPDIFLTFSTNGSIRTVDWWADLGKMVYGRRFSMIFGIDGVNQQQHSLYRQNTNLSKILNNAKAYIQNGGHAEWQMLLFKHNQDDIDTARAMAKEHGFDIFNIIGTERFWGKNIFKHRFKNEDRILERSEISLSYENWNQLETPLDSNTKISCFAKKDQQVYIDCMGYITPCCFLGMFQYVVAAQAYRPFNFEDYHDEYEELIDIFRSIDIERLQGKGKGLSQVVNDSWFHELEEMHKKLFPVKCRRVCGQSKD